MLAIMGVLQFVGAVPFVIPRTGAGKVNVKASFVIGFLK
jgi:hypothetical protein